MSKKPTRDPGVKKVAALPRQLTQASKKSVRRKAGEDLAPETEALAFDIGRMIKTARGHVAQTANAAMTTLYWQIGTRIRQDVLRERRAQYGAEIVSALGRQLETRFGRGFGEKNLRRMVQFVETFPDAEIVAALLRQLSWTHFTILMPLKDPLKREFYAEMCRVERWSTRTLRAKIDSMLYERTALSRKPEKLIREEAGRALPTLARPSRPSTRRRAAAGDHPLRGKERRDDRDP